MYLKSSSIPCTDKPCEHGKPPTALLLTPQVRAMEDRISTMYWSNGYLTFCDGQVRSPAPRARRARSMTALRQEAFERYTARRVHEAVSGIPLLGGIAWSLAPKLILKKVPSPLVSPPYSSPTSLPHARATPNRRPTAASIAAAATTTPVPSPSAPTAP